MTSPSAIIGATCVEFQITDEKFFGFLTHEYLKRARAAAAYLIDDMTSLKGVQITRALGRSGDAAVARNAIARARALLANDPAFVERVSTIRECARHWDPKPVVRVPIIQAPVAPSARNAIDEPPDVVEMRRMINAGTDLLRQAMLRERSPANAAGDAT